MMLVLFRVSEVNVELFIYTGIRLATMNNSLQCDLDGNFKMFILVSDLLHVT